MVFYRVNFMTTTKSMIHLEFILMLHVRYGFSFFPGATQLSQHYLIDKPVYPH